MLQNADDFLSSRIILRVLDMCHLEFRDSDNDDVFSIQGANVGDNMDK